jgi:hypothetical protein
MRKDEWRDCNRLLVTLHLPLPIPVSCFPLADRRSPFCQYEWTDYTSPPCMI